MQEGNFEKEGGSAGDEGGGTEGGVQESRSPGLFGCINLSVAIAIKFTNDVSHP